MNKVNTSKEKFPALLALVAATAIAIFLGGCEELSQSEVQEINDLYKLMVVDQVLDGIKFDVDENNPGKVGAYARYDNNTIYFTKSLLDMYKDHKISRNQMMWIIGHELGHLSHNAIQFRGTSEEEDYCDMYSLLLLEEIQHDGYPIDLYDAISYLKIMPGEGDSLHQHPAQRYANSLMVLQDWEITKHHKPEH